MPASSGSYSEDFPFLFLFWRNPLFIVMKNPLAPALPPLGAGAHCDTSVLPGQEISP
jgi:hypothetical protein